MEQPPLFDQEIKDDHTKIHGLKYIDGYILEDAEAELLSHIEQAQWRNDLKRRVQHYGYIYDYTTRAVRPRDYIGPLPAWLNTLAHKLTEDGIFGKTPDQAIINEYLPGQGISKHIDCTPCFGDTITSLSLRSACEMQFSNPRTGARRDQILQPRSLIVLKKAARYEWLHGIPARKSDMINGIRTSRTRRVSITFRTVII